MSCQDFEFVSVELARGSLIDAAARESALAHAAACAPCGERLRRGRALSVALREVSAAMRDREAPAGIEAVLLAAFRARREASAAVPLIDPASVRVAGASLAKGFAPHARRALVASAMAASLLLAFVGWRALDSRKAVAEGARVATGEAAPKESANETRQVARDNPSDQAATINQPTHSKLAGMHRATYVKAVRRRAPSAELPLAFVADGGRVVAVVNESASVAPAAGTPAARGDESASDFVPLATGEGTAPLDSGQTVRVEVPRAALAALGLPVNAGRAVETVRADVLLAHDGTARAIRLLP